jgi:hypothetical protein
VEVDPFSVSANNFLGEMLNTAGRCDEGAVQYRRTVEMAPNLSTARDGLADSYKCKGMVKESHEEEVKARIADGYTPREIEEYRKAIESPGRISQKQKRLANQLARWEKNQWHVTAYSIAMTYASLGDKDNAFAWIYKAFQLRSGMLVRLYVGDNPLRSDARFLEVRSQMGIPR